MGLLNLERRVRSVVVVVQGGMVRMEVGNSIRGEGGENGCSVHPVGHSMVHEKASIVMLVLIVLGVVSDSGGMIVRVDRNEVLLMGRDSVAG